MEAFICSRVREINSLPSSEEREIERDMMEIIFCRATEKEGKEKEEEGERGEIILCLLQCRCGTISRREKKKSKIKKVAMVRH